MGLKEAIDIISNMDLEAKLLRIRSTHKPKKITVDKEQAVALLKLLDLAKAVFEEVN